MPKPRRASLNGVSSVHHEEVGGILQVLRLSWVHSEPTNEAIIGKLGNADDQYVVEIISNALNVSSIV